MGTQLFWRFLKAGSVRSTARNCFWKVIKKIVADGEKVTNIKFETNYDYGNINCGWYISGECQVRKDSFLMNSLLLWRPDVITSLFFCFCAHLDEYVCLKNHLVVWRIILIPGKQLLGIFSTNQMAFTLNNCDLKHRVPQGS